MDTTNRERYEKLRETWGYLPALYVDCLPFLDDGDIVRLSEKVGGRRFSTDRQWKPDHPVVQAIGTEKAEALQNMLKSQFMIRVDFPFLSVRDRDKRRQEQVSKLYMEGQLSISEIAQAVAVTDRGVYQIIKRCRDLGLITGERNRVLSNRVKLDREAKRLDEAE